MHIRKEFQLWILLAMPLQDGMKRQRGSELLPTAVLLLCFPALLPGASSFFALAHSER